MKIYLLLFFCYISLFNTCFDADAQQNVSPISVHSIKECGLYICLDKTLTGWFEISNNTDSVIKIIDISASNFYIMRVFSAVDYGYDHKSLYIPAHQSIVCWYVNLYYRDLYGEKGGFKTLIKEKEGVRISEPSIVCDVYYWCGRKWKMDTNCRYYFNETISLDDVRSYHANMIKYFPDKNTNIHLPKPGILEIISTDTFGYYVGPKERELTKVDTALKVKIPAELQGYVKIKNTSSDTIKLCRYRAKNIGDTLSILFVAAGKTNEGANEWVIPPGKVAIVRYARRMNKNDLNDIRGFIARNPEFNGELTFCTKKESIVIPLHIEFKEKDLRTYYGKI